MANKNPEAKTAYEKAYEYGIGQVSTLFEREMTSTEDCTAFQRDLQKKIMEKSPHCIPAAFHMEGSCVPFICVAGEPASASRKLLKSLLREEVGNDGCVISDYGAVGNIHSVQKVGETAEEAAMKSLLAGTDCELPDGAVLGTKEFKDLIERRGGESQDAGPRPCGGEHPGGKVPDGPL